MSPTERSPSRRAVLQAAGSIAGVGGVAGSARAHPDSPNHVTVNVGYADSFGRDLVRAKADEVFREYTFDALTARLPLKALAALNDTPAVRYVERDGEMQALAQSLPWGVDRVAADVAHEQGKTGKGADVAILDTGIDADHPDLQSSLGTGAAAVNCSASDCTVAWDDDNGHGTHCAGIANAVSNTDGVVGVSTEATLHAVKVLNANGGGSYSNIAAGIQWVADRGYDVASMSFGAGHNSSVVRDAVKYAHGKGVFLVAAAGNAGPCSDCVAYPAAYDEVVAVSATTTDDSLASFSSTGKPVELAAPGRGIHSTVIDGYGTKSGTSMAAPHVAGAAAQLMAGGYSHAEARSRLTQTAEDLGLAKTEQGAGLPDLKTALSLSDGAPAVTTRSPVDVGVSGATFVASLDALGGAKSADVSFEYGPAGGPLDQQTSATTRSKPGEVRITVDGLQSDSAYEVRARVVGADGDAASGKAVRFHTPANTAIPALRSYTVSGMSSGDTATVTADWRVVDADGDLDTVTVEVLTAAGEQLRKTTTDVSGGEAAAVDTFQVPSGARYEVRLTAVDTAGNSRSISLPVGV